MLRTHATNASSKMVSEIVNMSAGGKTEGRKTTIKLNRIYYMLDSKN